MKILLLFFLLTGCYENELRTCKSSCVWGIKSFDGKKCECDSKEAVCK